MGEEIGFHIGEVDKDSVVEEGVVADSFVEVVVADCKVVVEVVGEGYMDVIVVIFGIVMESKIDDQLD